MKPVTLEDFGQNSAVQHRPASPVEQPDATAVFDDGYKNGWQDGVASMQGQDTEIRQSIATALEEINFTYYEARQHILKSMRPLIEAILERALPTMMRDALGPTIVETLESVSETIEPPVKISCAMACVDELKALFGENTKFPAEIKGEETLIETQAVLHLDEGQTRIDLDDMLQKIRDAVEAFYSTQPDEDKRYG